MVCGGHPVVLSQQHDRCHQVYMSRICALRRAYSQYSKEVELGLMHPGPHLECQHFLARFEGTQSQSVWTQSLVYAAAPGVRQGMPDRPSTSAQYSRPQPPAAQPPESMEFDPNILWKAMGVVPPSFAPVAEDNSHKRSHDQMQVCLTDVCCARAAGPMF